MLNNCGRQPPMRSVKVLIERLNCTNQKNIAVKKSNGKIASKVEF